ncbi:hypothetical protein P0F65_05205 [Sphingomonas sp. I4]
MGIEDFRQQDANRDISAVRNFYAGVLLLAKEAMIRKAPNADPMLVIGAKLKPVADGAGGIEMAKVGHTTIDFQQIGERARDLGVQLDHKALKTLNSIRNDMEHHYTDESENAIRAAISKGFPVVSSLLKQMGEDPVTLLDDAWEAMLRTKELYDTELREARATLEKVKWYSPSLNETVFTCHQCQSELIEQRDAENVFQSDVEFRCKTCGGYPELEDAIERALDEAYDLEAFIRAHSGEEMARYTPAPRVFETHSLKKKRPAQIAIAN